MLFITTTITTIPTNEAVRVYNISEEDCKKIISSDDLLFTKMISTNDATNDAKVINDLNIAVEFVDYCEFNKGDRLILIGVNDKTRMYIF